jgi:hypothetical protein
MALFVNIVAICTNLLLLREKVGKGRMRIKTIESEPKLIQTGWMNFKLKVSEPEATSDRMDEFKVKSV